MVRLVVGIVAPCSGPVSVTDAPNAVAALSERKTPRPASPAALR